MSKDPKELVPDPLPELVLPEQMDLTRGADFTFKFRDGATLKAHSYLLKLASPVFEKMFNDIKGDSSFLKLDDDPSVWSLLLCCTHPTGQPCFADAIRGYSLDQLGRVVSMAKKYQVEAVRRSVDGVLGCKLDQQRQLNARCGNRAGVRAIVMEQLTVAQLLDWTVRHGLDNSVEACVDWILNCCVQGCTHYAQPSASFSGGDIAEVISSLADDGYTRAGTYLAGELLRRMHIV